MEEEENFQRNLRVLVECGNETFREVMSFELSQQNVTLEQFLSQNRHDIYHLHSKNRCCQCSGSSNLFGQKPFNKAQLDIFLDKHQHLPGHNTQSTFLFCCSPVKSSITLDDLDATLLRGLLTNYGNYYKKNAGIANNVERLIQIRNRYAHIPGFKLSDAEFKSDKNDIINTIRQIISLCGCSPDAMNLKISDSYQKTLDRSLLMQYHAKLVEDLEWQTEIQEGQAKILDNLQELLRGQEDSSNSQKDLQEEIVRLVAGLNACRVPCNVSAETSSGQSEKVESCQQIVVDTDQLAKCTTKQSPDIKKVGSRRIKTARRKAKTTEGSQSDSAIKNLTDQSKLMVEQHEQDQVYVETKIVKRGLEILSSHSLLFLVAKSGTGKSKICLQIASLMKQQKTMIPIFLLNNEIVSKRDLISPNKNYLLIIEDLFGRENPCYVKDIHDNILCYIQNWACLGMTKVIMTISADIGVANDILKRHNLFKNDCIMAMDTDFPLDIVERRNIFCKHAEMNSIRFSKERCKAFCGQNVQKLQDGSFEICQCLVQNIISTDTYIGFPQCCSMFCQDRCLIQLGIKYFRNPSDELVQQINTQLLEKALNRDIDCLYRYVLLVYMALTEHALKLSYTQNDEFFKDELLLSVFKSINETTVNIRAIKVNTALKFLEKTYLKKVSITKKSALQTVVDFQHYTIKKAVLVSFGGEFPDKVIEFCDLRFIIDFVFPNGLGSTIEPPKEMIYVDHKLVLGRIYKILGKYGIFTRTNTGLKCLTEKEQDTFLKSGGKSIPIYFPCELIGRYLKQYSGGNEKPIIEFLDEISTAGMNTETELVIRGLLDNDTSDQCVMTFPTVCQRYLLSYGGPSVFSETVRPNSSHGRSTQFLYVDDSLLINSLLNETNRPSDNLSGYEIGKYVATVKNEGNSEFFCRMFQAVTHPDGNRSIRNRFYHRFLDGLLFALNFDKQILQLLVPLVLQHGSPLALITCCRPKHSAAADDYYYRLDGKELLKLLREHSDNFFVDQVIFNDVLAHNYYKHRLGGIQLVQVLFERCLIFAKDVGDDEYMGELLEIVIVSMTTVVLPNIGVTYLYFLHLFRTIFNDERLSERYPNILQYLKILETTDL